MEFELENAEEILDDLKNTIPVEIYRTENGETTKFVKYELLEKQVLENKRLNNIIYELENRDDVLEEFEDWLERQKTRNSEWDNFIMVDGRLGIPLSYLLNKLQELKEKE